MQGAGSIYFATLQGYVINETDLYTSPCLYVKYFTQLISKMYLMRVLSFVGDVRFNVRGEHVPGCLGRG